MYGFHTYRVSIWVPITIRGCAVIITDLLKRFGHDIEPEHENLMSTILQQLTDSRAVVRKRATASLGSLAIVLSDPLLKRLTETLLGMFFLACSVSRRG